MSHFRNVVIAALFAFFSLPASANYDYYLSLGGLHSPTGYCYSGISVVECGPVYSSSGTPVPGFSLGSSFNRVTLNVHAQDGPVQSDAGAIAEFAVFPANQLTRLYLLSDGQNTVRNCDSSGANCFQASAWALPVQFQFSIQDIINVTVPASYDGIGVNATFRIPITAFGDGSSYGNLSARFFNSGGHYEFGHLNFNGGHWEADHVMTFEVPLRAAGDTNRNFSVPFFFQSDFRSSTVNGPGFISSLNSIGLTAESLDGVTFSSESGLLDAALAVGQVPEPETYAMLLAGLAGLAFSARRRRLHTKR